MKQGRIPKVITLLRRDGVHLVDVEAGLVLLGTTAAAEVHHRKSASPRSEPPPSDTGGRRRGLA
jgi:hypothetical protein